MTDKLVFSHYMQSEAFAEYMSYLGWQVHPMKTDLTQIYSFSRRLPLIGTMIKVPKVLDPIPFSKIKKIIDQNNAQICRIELQVGIDRADIAQALSEAGYRKTWLDCELQTRLIDLRSSTEKILASFPRENTRRNIRAALNSNFRSWASDDFETFYGLHKQLSRRKHFYCPPRAELQYFWQQFRKRDAAKIILVEDANHQPLVGVLLLFYKKTAYYRIVGSVSQADQTPAASLAVWQCLFTAKALGCDWFDFGGVTDERNLQKDWQGYSHFKAGFTKQTVQYLAPMAYYSKPIGSIFGLLQRF